MIMHQCIEGCMLRPVGTATWREGWGGDQLEIEEGNLGGEEVSRIRYIRLHTL